MMVASKLCMSVVPRQQQQQLCHPVVSATKASVFGSKIHIIVTYIAMATQTLHVHDKKQCHIGDMDMTVLCAFTGSSVLLAPSDIITHHDCPTAVNMSAQPLRPARLSNQ